MPTKTSTTKISHAESASTPLVGCVASPDRDYAVAVNDSAWSSPEARAQHMLPLALAQIGTAGTDRTVWEAHVLEGTIRRVLPLPLRAAARVHPDATHQATLVAAADRCASDGTREAARAAYVAASDAADYVASGFAAAHAADYAADYAAAAYVASDAAAYVVAYAVYAASTTAAGDDSDLLLITAVSVALDAYAAEGRQTCTM